MNHALLNALVAERVMGWKWCDKFMHWYPPGPDVTLNDTRTKKDFDPSRNIAHAMEVFDRFTDAIIEKAGAGYEVTISAWATAHHADKCIAICLAALRAVGVPDKEIEEVANG